MRISICRLELFSYTIVPTGDGRKPPSGGAGPTRHLPGPGSMDKPRPGSSDPVKKSYGRVWAGSITFFRDQARSAFNPVLTLKMEKNCPKIGKMMKNGKFRVRARSGPWPKPGTGPGPGQDRVDH